MSRFEPPMSISAAARESLANAPYPISYPAQGDVDGWLAHVADVDGFLSGFVAAEGASMPSVDRMVSGVPVTALHPEGSDPDGPVVLHFHPGGLIYGGGPLAAGMTMRDAQVYGLPTWAPDYRMPPLHPYPAALDDAVAVYRELLEERPPEQVVVAGGSAGGNIAAALLLRARDEGLPMPAAAVLMTPEVDLTESGDSFQVNRDADNTLASLSAVNELYAAGHDLEHPYLSPLFGDLTGFPPTFIQSGTRDLFLSNAVRFHRRLLGFGVPAELHVFEARPHSGFPGIPQAPEDAEVADAVRDFVDRHITP